MEYSIEKTSQTSVSLSVTCSADEVKKAFERAAKAIGKGMNLPGFRVGKIPVECHQESFRFPSGGRCHGNSGRRQHDGNS